LTGEFADLVNDPKSRGTILLAFGTILNWKEAPAEQREAFAEALNKLPDYRIIWACRQCPAMNLGSHVRLLDWIPQQELLNHPRTKLFITHGGLKSLKEATCAKMPTLFLPIFGEQVRNSWLAYHHGFGQIINKFNVTADYLLSLIQDMLSNPSYKQNAEKLRSYFEDAPIPPLQEGAFKIKRLIKYGGRMPEYFYTRSINIDYIRYLNLDLILLIPSLTCLLLLVK
uniref:glucuronosyltransferase n=1 Tax=Gongylonema pulchrum TaxID=637853 RepID=A0A183D5S3_9BILA